MSQRLTMNLQIKVLQITSSFQFESNTSILYATCFSTNDLHTPRWFICWYNVPGFFPCFVCRDNLFQVLYTEFYAWAYDTHRLISYDLLQAASAPFFLPLRLANLWYLFLNTLRLFVPHLIHTGLLWILPICPLSCLTTLLFTRTLVVSLKSLFHDIGRSSLCDARFFTCNRKDICQFLHIRTPCCCFVQSRIQGRSWLNQQNRLL